MLETIVVYAYVNHVDDLKNLGSIILKSKLYRFLKDDYKKMIFSATTQNKRC